MSSEQPPQQLLPRSSPELAIGDEASLNLSSGEKKVIYSGRKLQNINCILAPTQKLGGVYLGDVVSTIKQDLIRHYQIRAIMTCMSENVAITSKVAFHKIIPIKDLYDYPIINHFDESIQWISQKRDEKINILVHCHAGVSRSATVIIAYLIRTNGWSPVEALKYVQQRRERVKPNASFWAQLTEYYNYWRQQNQKLGQIVPLQKSISQNVQNIHNVQSPQNAKVIQSPQSVQNVKNMQSPQTVHAKIIQSPQNVQNHNGKHVQSPQNVQHQRSHQQNVSVDNLIQPLSLPLQQKRAESKSMEKGLQRLKVIPKIQLQPQEMKLKKEKTSMSQTLKFTDKRQNEKEQKVNNQPLNSEYYLSPKDSEQSTSFHTNDSGSVNPKIQTQRHFNQNRTIEPRMVKRVVNGEQKIMHNNSCYPPLPGHHLIPSNNRPYVISSEIHSSPFLNQFPGVVSHWNV